MFQIRRFHQGKSSKHPTISSRVKNLDLWLLWDASCGICNRQIHWRHDLNPAKDGNFKTNVLKQIHSSWPKSWELWRVVFLSGLTAQPYSSVRAHLRCWYRATCVLIRSPSFVHPEKSIFWGIASSLSQTHLLTTLQAVPTRSVLFNVGDKKTTRRSSQLYGQEPLYWHSRKLVLSSVLCTWLFDHHVQMICNVEA